MSDRQHTKSWEETAETELVGRGAEIGGEFDLTAREILQIAVGGAGRTSAFGAGGGGKTSIYQEARRHWLPRA